VGSGEKGECVSPNSPFIPDPLISKSGTNILQKNVSTAVKRRKCRSCSSDDLASFSSFSVDNEADVSITIIKRRDKWVFTCSRIGSGISIWDINEQSRSEAVRIVELGYVGIIHDFHLHNKSLYLAAQPLNLENDGRPNTLLFCKLHKLHSFRTLTFEQSAEQIKNDKTWSYWKKVKNNKVVKSKEYESILLFFNQLLFKLPFLIAIFLPLDPPFISNNWLNRWNCISLEVRSQGGRIIGISPKQQHLAMSASLAQNLHFDLLSDPDLILHFLFDLEPHSLNTPHGVIVLNSKRELLFHWVEKLDCVKGLIFSRKNLSTNYPQNQSGLTLWIFGWN